MKTPTFRRWLVPVALAVSVTHACIAQEEPKHALQVLEDALRNEGAASRAAAPTRDRETVDEDSGYLGRRGNLVANWMPQLRAYLDMGRSEQVEQLLTEIIGYDKSEPVLAACRQLREELRREHEAAEQAVLKSYRDAAANAEHAVRSAQVPADLDAALRELGGLGNDTRDYRATGAVQAEANRVNKLRRYVILWQDYLVSRQHGDNQTASQKLLQISQDGSAEIFPRSEILSRIEQLKTSQETSVTDRTGEILGKLKSPDQIAEVVRELQASQAHSGNDPSSYSARTNLGNIIVELQSYADIYNSYQAGLPVSVADFANRSWLSQQSPPAEVQNVKAQLLRLVCVRQFALEGRFKPGADESVPDYLNRLLADAREHSDARTMLRVREIQRQVNPQRTTYTVQPTVEATAALQAIVAAQNQEEAGQFIPAVVSYENALKNGSDVVPARAIGARLDAIRSAHPAEYERGMQISLGTPAATGETLLPR